MVNKAVIVLGSLAVAGVLFFALTRKAEAAPPPPPGFANLYGKVTDAVSGKPIAGVLVGLNGMETFTDGSGNYLFTNLDPGDYRLEFAKEGYETAVY